MIPTFLFLLLGPFTVNASTAADPHQIRNGEQLARFIYAGVSGSLDAKDLLAGIRSNATLSLPSYRQPIPIKEIYGTIVSERFDRDLGREFFEKNKRYDVRAVCAFRNEKNELVQFRIIVFDARQYRLIERFLQGKLKET
jgi:hypothetical protein